MKKVNSDERGDIYELQFGKQSYVLVTFNEGVARGGHWHKNMQMHTLIAGKMIVILKDMEIDNTYTKVMLPGDTLYIKPKVAHLFIAEKPSILAETRKGGYEATEYSPYRKLVK